MGRPKFFKMDPVKKINQRITDNGNNSGYNYADNDLGKVPGQKTNDANDQDDEEEFVFLVECLHVLIVRVQKYSRKHILHMSRVHKYLSEIHEKKIHHSLQQDSGL